jgi:hypothetical protein
MSDAPTPALISRVDGFRVLSGVNTSVRILRVCSAVVQMLGVNTLHKELLKEKMMAWSIDLSQHEDYAKREGTLTTTGGKPTTAFQHYLSFLQSLKWISVQGDAVRNSRLGFLLGDLIKKTSSTDLALSSAEKLFYLHEIFRRDADTLLTLLGMLSQGGFSKKADLQEKFDDEQSERWKQKQRYADFFSKDLIWEAEKEIRFKSKPAKDEKLRHKHLVPTRLEWLKDLGLGILSPKPLGLTDGGRRFFDSLLMLPESNIKEINQAWLEQSATAAFCRLVLPTAPFQLWGDLSLDEKAKTLAPLLKNADALFGDDGAMRLPFYATLLYLSISLASSHRIVAELADLASTLENEFFVDGRAYSARRAARETESYITYSLR